jgi:hypothetical protein
VGTASTAFLTDNRASARASALRARLRMGLAGLWMVNGLLMLQPAVLTPMLFIDVLGPNEAVREPGWFRHIALWGVHFWLRDPRAGSLVIAVGQLALGAVIGVGRERWWGRAGLLVSVVWGLIVWIFAEGLGGLLTGNASMVLTMPGPAPFLMAAAILLLVPRDLWVDGTVARRVRQGMGWLWLMAAGLQALPSAGYWTGSRLAGLFGDVTMYGTQPPILAQMINAMIMTTMTHAVIDNLILVLIMAGLAYAWLLRPMTPRLVAVTLVWLGFLWVVPQAFGTLFTGTAISPGMEWALALLLVAAVDPRQEAGSRTGTSVSVAE